MFTFVFIKVYLSETSLKFASDFTELLLGSDVPLVNKFIIPEKFEKWIQILKEFLLGWMNFSYNYHYKITTCPLKCE